MEAPDGLDRPHGVWLSSQPVLLLPCIRDVSLSHAPARLAEAAPSALVRLDEA